MISNIAKECDVNSITIIAHSAGSPIVVNALREIRLLEYDLPAEEVQQKYRINSVVLAAPDMDLMDFNNGIYDRFYEVAGRVAVYASPDDQALRISEKLNGNKRLGRAVGRLKIREQETSTGSANRDGGRLGRQSEVVNFHNASATSIAIPG